MNSARHELRRWWPVSIDDIEIMGRDTSGNVFKAYILLVLHQWRTGEPLPDDDKKLASISGLDIRVWRRLRKEILKTFARSPGYLSHIFTRSELQHSKKVSEKNRAAANSRWNPSMQMHQKNGCDCNAITLHNTSTTCVRSKGLIPKSSEVLKKQQKLGSRNG